MDAQSQQEIVAGEVRAWLGRRQRSGRSVALELGWTEIYMNRRIRGLVPFNVADLEAIAKLLEVSVTEFFQAPRPADAVRPSGSTGRYLDPDWGDGLGDGHHPWLCSERCPCKHLDLGAAA